MAEKFVDAYDTTTGSKVPQRVPENWLGIFPHLSLTPKQKAARGRSTTPTTKNQEA